MNIILHSDLNSYYASVEALHRPSLRDKPLAVGGDEEARHGIVLTKNDKAKLYQVKTGMTLWEARQNCPNLVVVPVNMPLYLRFSRLAREIYSNYSPFVESYGIDEAWLDLGKMSIEEGAEIANEIRCRIKKELGITVSIGVSYNKIFAKLGSDLKKPNAISVISRENYQNIAWPLPVSDLLYVGRATNQKLRSRCIYTIGDLAKEDPMYLKSFLHKPGEMLWAWANGYDTSSVASAGEEQVIKSIGNSITAPRDLINNQDVQMVFIFLAESVAARLRESGFECSTVVISVRDKELRSFERQMTLQHPTTLVTELVNAAMKIFTINHRWPMPVRSIGIRGANLSVASQAVQYTFLPEEAQRIRLEALEKTIDSVRNRYGYRSIRRALTLVDDALTSVDAKTEHTVHPIAYRR